MSYYPVYVKTLFGKTITLHDVKGTDSILMVKALIKVTEGIHPDQQRLMFAGKYLEDTKTVAECGILAESTLHLISRLITGHSVGDR